MPLIEEEEKIVFNAKKSSFLYKGMQDDVFLHQSMIDQSMLESRMVSTGGNGGKY